MTLVDDDEEKSSISIIIVIIHIVIRVVAGVRQTYFYCVLCVLFLFQLQFDGGKFRLVETNEEKKSI